MESIERQHGEAHDCTLKADEVALRLDQTAIPALTKLRNTVHRPCEDAQRRERQSDKEALESPASAEARVRRIQSVGGSESLRASKGAPSEVGGEDDEDEEGEHLDRKTGNHDVVANGGVLVAMRGGRCEAPASGLK